ncbi:DUF4272 domain-containing protein [Acinetobacter qingfengensis]|uniref:Uncharacterized protein n=1 Tax=Acinetobacter qingfengensis TaxID=1262585 RepID=A0A1E7RCS6_9GAMM|nr:DUF4272 domain-containing protein [Acinetobacter qingfengensis]KAA8735124.1 DUF4272 domain-containing protein [Acinetobacter qingfengensis]OEY97027.1 hypothetical protein BJI46_11220 [Acinetobacter qingfengensis]
MKNPEQRKQQSILKLKQNNIPYIDWLPCIESSDEVVLRSVDNIAKRAISCLLMIQIACDINNQQYDAETKEFIDTLLNKFVVKNELTFKELAIFNDQASAQDVINMIWKYEAYWVLLWALGIVDELDYPDHTIDCDFAIQAVSSCESLAEFMAKVKLRNIEDILDQADLIYRYDWACVNARLKQQPAPANLNASVVVERHGALNWLIQQDSDWDHPDVST